MAARKDLLKAHEFTTQRLQAALVNRDPDNPQRPLRRVALGTFVGTLVAVILLAGFGILGYIRKPSTTTWQQPNTILVDSSAGVVFVYYDHGESASPRYQLHPIVNITSARLITGGTSIKTVRTASLAGVSRGATYGIPAAPSQLPDPSDMAPYPIRVCAMPTGVDAQGLPRPRYTTLELGVAPAAATGTSVAVSSADGRQFLVMDGAYYELPQTQGAATAILGGAYVAEHADRLLRSLPAGRPLEPVHVPSTGVRVEKAQRTVGSVAAVGDAADKDSLRYYILRLDGWSRISYLDMVVLSAVNRVSPEQVSAAEIGSFTSPVQSSATVGLSEERPAIWNNGASTRNEALCATYNAAGAAPVITVGGTVPAVPTGVTPLTDTYDAVVTVAGGGALLRDSAAVSQQSATSLVWEGHRYGIPDAASLESLGYASHPQVASVVSGIIAMIPSGLPAGVVLNQENASQPVETTSR